ncbi:MAG TPA: hypothetical protein VNJ53_10035 [Gaiellaceae bacterium]|nr:hypothetical protein [Gaiellaceae bacterium]
MSAQGDARELARVSSPPRALRPALAVGSYAALGLILAWSRLGGLGAGFCCDETIAVARYVRGGPDEIFGGAYLPNNHQLFSVLAWATSSLAGESEVALRLWSALPFLAGVVLVTVWLHARLGALPGLLFLFLATASPLLLDLSRQARGYGLAFLAMCVLTVGALEATRSGRAGALVAFCAGGLLGLLTLPHFAVAFVAVGAVLATRSALRVRVVVGQSLALALAALWWSPHLDDLLAGARQEYGARIEGAWLASAPLDQILIPALTMIDESFVRPSAASLVAALVFAALMVASPLVRDPRPALVLVGGPAASVLAFWAAGAPVMPRFFSFLLVPLFVLVATGIAALLARPPSRSAVPGWAVALAALLAVALASGPRLVEIPRLPREALREAASAIRAQSPPRGPVLAHLPYPHDLEFHLARPVTWVVTREDAAAACSGSGPAVVVMEAWRLDAKSFSCLRRPGTRHFAFEQYARGGRVDVWFLPPQA